jgi:hypothetical protein
MDYYIKGENLSLYRGLFARKSPMNWSVKYVRDKHYVQIVLEGNFTAEGLIQMMEDVVAREFWQPGMNVLTDFRKVEFDADSLAAIRQVSDKRLEKERQIGSGKSALLMNSLADYGRGRQYQLQIESKASADLHVFTDEKEALDWLLA